MTADDFKVNIDGKTALTPNDRVAILSFDSHLKIWTDFTNDRERLRRVLAHGLLFERPPAVQATSMPSLVDRLDPDRGRRTYDIERALELIGEALEPLPGSKSLVLIGYGFGIASRTAVFSLDVEKPESQRASHQIEVELTRRKGHVFATSTYSERDRQR